ncbi:RDD family protein [Gimesia maris]|uniref:RDD family protein n=1 Tax=Gimesia maris TaxID=122 RepID=A0ABX5YMB2_9PLAN|nr:RDD family protein [Gimesia maris]QEG16753.1 RDD family protein [Gimesia maris]QGQ30090.1 RDD family protein [Gimesia maris]
MNCNDLCQKLRVSEKQLWKICRHLKITVSNEIDRVFTPREIQRLEFFVEQKRSAARKNPSTTRNQPAVTEILSASSEPETVPAIPTPAVSLPVTDSASVGIRVCAYLIDCLATFALAPLVLIPILGLMFIGVLLSLYWLMRDVAGSSPGKIILGLQVLNNNDDPFWVGPRILRNLPLAIGPIFLCIPVIGILVGAPITILMILVEAAMLLITGKRIGDLLSGTSVIIIPKARWGSEP